MKIGITSNTNPFLIYLQETILYKKYIVIDLDNYKKDLTKLDFIIIFNPYKSKKVFELYEYCKIKNIKYYIVERGALQNSIFFDPNGFNFDSSSYDSTLWDYEISIKNREKLETYILKEKNLSSSLEEQKTRINIGIIKKELNAVNKKIIFVPLQKPSDTVIQHFAGSVDSYDNFIENINSLYKKLTNDYVLIVKNHPTEVNLPTSLNDNIKTVNYNIKDLIEISDYIILINSGVGVLAMLWYKPVIVMGDAFYQNNLLNRKAKNSNEIIRIIHSNFIPDKEKCNRFISYLINEFYSFGEFKYEKKSDKRELKEVSYCALRLGEISFTNFQSLNLLKTKTFYSIYRNSPISKSSQSIKKIPILGKSLLWFKHKILKWHM